MSNEPTAGDGAEDEVPAAVKEWLSSVAAQRDVSETELLRALLAGGDQGAPDRPVDDRQLDRLEDRFRTMIDDVRERVIQVKREADEKAPTDHAHRDLNSSIEQLGRDLVAIEAEIEQLDDRLSAGFDNYEEILTYLTETTDELNRRLARLTSAVIDLREQVGDAARDEARRTTLAHLTQTANRYGVEGAKCNDCGEAVDLSLLVEPRCPHCDSVFSSLEPKTGFFRKSVLHTGQVPALESARPEAEASAEALAAFVDVPEGGVGEEPAPEPAPETYDQPTRVVADGLATDGNAADAPAPPTGEETDGIGDLQSIDGIGPAYAERLHDVGIDDVLELAVADADELGAAIDVPASTVADWIDQAAARTGA